MSRSRSSQTPLPRGTAPTAPPVAQSNGQTAATRRCARLVNNRFPRFEHQSHHQQQEALPRMAYRSRFRLPCDVRVGLLQRWRRLALRWRSKPRQQCLKSQRLGREPTAAKGGCAGTCSQRVQWVRGKATRNLGSSIARLDTPRLTIASAAVPTTTGGVTGDSRVGAKKTRTSSALSTTVVPCQRPPTVL